MTRASALLLAVFALVGCEKDEIRTYRAPKNELPPTVSSEKEQAPPKPRLTYQVPSSWKEIPAKGMRVAAFEIVDGGHRAQVTVIPASGGLLENVNRWRGQIGLAAISQQELEQQVQQIEVASSTATYVDLQGPEQRILGVILPRSNQTWFFKMQGPSALVEREKSAFESFVKSVKIDG